MAPPETSQSPLQDLVTANHILHHHHIVDAYGHISLRSPSNPKTFYLSHSIAPALVSQASDIIEYNIEDASPVDSKIAAKGYVERYIHSEILKKFPGVNSVVHSHSEAVLAYGISGVPMRAAFHMAGFLGTNVPIFDISKHYTRSDTHNLLVSNTHLGAALATSFSKSDSYAARVGAGAAALVSSFTKGEDASSAVELHPDYTVVLMRGHGFTAIGSNIKEVVFRAVYTQQNAGVQSTASMIRNAYLNAEERGKAKEEKAATPDVGPHFLSEQEVQGCKEMGQKTVDRPWGLWVREVEAQDLYVNNVKSS